MWGRRTALSTSDWLIEPAEGLAAGRDDEGGGLGSKGSRTLRQILDPSYSPLRSPQTLSLSPSVSLSPVLGY